MSFTAEVKGKSADRYRAYHTAKSVRKPVAQDHIERAEKNLPPIPDRAKVRYDGQHVALEGQVSGSSVSIAAKDVTITKVVFYAGPVEEERVVGSVDVDSSGDIVIELVEPAVTDEPDVGENQIVDI